MSFICLKVVDSHWRRRLLYDYLWLENIRSGSRFQLSHWNLLILVGLLLRCFSFDNWSCGSLLVWIYQFSLLIHKRNLFRCRSFLILSIFFFNSITELSSLLVHILNDLLLTLIKFMLEIIWLEENLSSRLCSFKHSVGCYKYLLFLFLPKGFLLTLELLPLLYEFLLVRIKPKFALFILKLLLLHELLA